MRGMVRHRELFLKTQKIIVQIIAAGGEKGATRAIRHVEHAKNEQPSVSTLPQQKRVACQTPQYATPSQPCVLLWVVARVLTQKLEVSIHLTTT